MKHKKPNGKFKYKQMTNAEKQALRDKINAIIAKAQAKNDTEIEADAIEALASVPPDEDPGPGDPPD